MLAPEGRLQCRLIKLHCLLLTFVRNRSLLKSITSVGTQQLKVELQLFLECFCTPGRKRESACFSSRSAVEGKGMEGGFLARLGSEKAGRLWQSMPEDEWQVGTCTGSEAPVCPG